MEGGREGGRERKRGREREREREGGRERERMSKHNLAAKISKNINLTNVIKYSY